VSSATRLVLILTNSRIDIVVSTERLVLWRSEIFGGISNEISVLLNQSTLPKEMEGRPFGRELFFFYFQLFVSQRKATWTRERRIPRPSCVWATQPTTGRA
jgi:hypothetical protein